MLFSACSLFVAVLWTGLWTFTVVVGGGVTHHINILHMLSTPNIDDVTMNEPHLCCYTNTIRQLHFFNSVTKSLKRSDAIYAII